MGTIELSLRSIQNQNDSRQPRACNMRVSITSTCWEWDRRVPDIEMQLEGFGCFVKNENTNSQLELQDTEEQRHQYTPCSHRNNAVLRDKPYRTIWKDW